MAFFPHSSHQEPKTRDETRQGYLPLPVQDQWASAARGVRRGMHGMSQITLPATTALHSINARTNAERDKREVRFFFQFGRYTPSYSWILAYVELERINEWQHFQIGIISKFESILFPRASLFLWRPRRAVSVLLSTTNCSTWRGESSGDPSYEIGDN